MTINATEIIHKLALVTGVLLAWNYSAGEQRAYSAVFGETAAIDPVDRRDDVAFAQRNPPKQREGRIEFEGRNLSGLSPDRITREGIARTFQIPQFFPSLTVKKSISVGSRFGTQGGLDPRHVAETIRFVGLEAEKARKTGQLNLLGKKKLMIGAALATRPKILMLDEPMAGSNATEIKTLMALIRRINRELGITVIIIEHFMKVLTELTERLLIIESGAMVCCDSPEVVTCNPEVIECYIGDAYAESN